MMIALYSEMGVGSSHSLQAFFEDIQEKVDEEHICLACNRTVEDYELEDVQKYVSTEPRESYYSSSPFFADC